MDADDYYEYESEEDTGVITLQLTKLLQGAREVYDEARASYLKASHASRALDRKASQQTVLRVQNHVKSAPAESTTRTEAETSMVDISTYTACLNIIMKSLELGKAKLEALERDTVPKSTVSDLTAKYGALQVDKATLSEAVPLIRAGKGIVEIATQLGMPVGYEAEYDQSCLDTGSYLISD